jgi:Na+/H+-translocating membrane pyrophosphatase
MGKWAVIAGAIVGTILLAPAVISVSIVVCPLGLISAGITAGLQEILKGKVSKETQEKLKNIKESLLMVGVFPIFLIVLGKQVVEQVNDKGAKAVLQRTDFKW